MAPLSYERYDPSRSLDDDMLAGVPPSVAAALRDPSAPFAVPGEEVRAVAASPLGPFLVGRGVADLELGVLIDALAMLPVPPHRLRRVLVRLRRVAGVIDTPVLMDTLVRLEHQLTAATAPLPEALRVSWWLPRSLGVSIDATVLLFERTGVTPSGVSAAWPVIAAAELAGVRSLFDTDHAQRTLIEGTLDPQILRSTAQALHLLGAHASVTRLLVLLDVIDPDPSGVERRLLRHLVIRREAAVPPERVVDIWRMTF
jgi:hypothetical protein